MHQDARFGFEGLQGTGSNVRVDDTERLEGHDAQRRSRERHWTTAQGLVLSSSSFFIDGDFVRHGYRGSEEGKGEKKRAQERLSNFSDNPRYL